MPLVSVVIPTYNRPDYLRNAIHSALGQSHTELEILVFDDAGPEVNEAVAASFHDSRIQYFRNESNRGTCFNSLQGFRLAKGKYISVLNDDDEWEREFVAKMVAALEDSPQSTVAFCDHFIMNTDGDVDYAATDENTRFWKREGLAPGLHQDWARMGFVDHSIPMSTGAVLRRASIDWGFFPLEVGSYYDFWLTYLAWKSGGGAYYVPERLTRYRVHAGMQTGLARIGNLKAKIACLEFFLRDPGLAPIHGELREKLNETHCRLGRVLLLHGMSRDARRQFSIGFSCATLTDYCSLALCFTPAPVRTALLRARQRE